MLRVAKVKDVEVLQERARKLSERVNLLREELGRAIIGQDELLSDLLTAVLAGGHVLLEGLPGLGKTLLVKSLAQCLGLDFARIQFTPDLMPADIIGSEVLEEVQGRFNVPALHIVEPFFADPGFLDAWAEAGEKGRWPGEVRPHTTNRRHIMRKVMA